MPTLDTLLDCLHSEDPKIRNQAAIQLMDFGERAVKVLIEQIQQPAHANNRGTLTYALQVFNCSAYFEVLFGLALHANYETSLHAYEVLKQQNFAVTTEQIEKAQRALDDLLPRESLSEADVEALRRDLQPVLDRLVAGRKAAQLASLQ